MLEPELFKMSLRSHGTFIKAEANFLMRNSNNLTEKTSIQCDEAFPILDIKYAALH